MAQHTPRSLVPGPRLRCRASAGADLFLQFASKVISSGVVYADSATSRQGIAFVSSSLSSPPRIADTFEGRCHPMIGVPGSGASSDAS